MSNGKGIEDLARLEGMAREVANLIGPVFDQAGACFALLGFQKGANGWATFLSNADRRDMIRALREMAGRLEEEEDLPPIQPGEPVAS